MSAFTSCLYLLVLSFLGASSVDAAPSGKRLGEANVREEGQLLQPARRARRTAERCKLPHSADTRVTDNLSEADFAAFDYGMRAAVALEELKGVGCARELEEYRRNALRAYRKKRSSSDIVPSNPQVITAHEAAVLAGFSEAASGAASSVRNKRDFDWDDVLENLVSRAIEVGAVAGVAACAANPPLCAGTIAVAGGILTLRGDTANV